MSEYNAVEYRAAFAALAKKVTPAQRRMLAANAAAKRRTLDVLALARAAGQRGEEFTYSQYGRLGHLVANALGHHRPERVWTRMIASDSRNRATGRVQWTLRRAVAEAVVALGWVEAGSAEDSRGGDGAPEMLVPQDEDVRYFVLKGTPENDWKAYLRPGRIGEWWTARPPRRIWKEGDRFFCWESSPGKRLVGLASLASSDAGTDEHGRQLFGVRYLTPMLANPVPIEELLRAPIARSASFLRPGPSTTVQQLARDQAEAVFAIVVARNPAVASVWPDLGVEAPAGPAMPDLDEVAVTEGGVRVRVHLARERNSRIIEAKKRSVLSAGRRLVCEVCGFDFAAEYGERGEGFCEVHHLRPLAESEGARKTRLQDLAVICSNCHRILHRSKPWPSVAGLRRVVRRSRSRSE